MRLPRQPGDDIAAKGDLAESEIQPLKKKGKTGKGRVMNIAMDQVTKVSLGQKSQGSKLEIIQQDSFAMA